LVLFDYTVEHWGLELYPAPGSWRIGKLSFLLVDLKLGLPLGRLEGAASFLLLARKRIDPRAVRGGVRLLAELP